jgi:hypothetical protein
MDNTMINDIETKCKSVLNYLIPNCELRLSVRQYNNAIDVLKTLTCESDSYYNISKHNIILYREDLVKDKQNKDISDITFYDFKSSVMSQEETFKSDVIIFIDGDQIKLLKRKY